MPPRCPIKKKYNRSLHTIHVSYSSTDSSHTQEDHATRLVKWIQTLQQQVHNNLQQTKQDNFFSKENNSPRFRFNKILPQKLMQWIPLLAKGGGLIQVDIDGHPPIQLVQIIFFHLGNFSKRLGSF
jgi:cell wall assembly regulator SMI1